MGDRHILLRPRPSEGFDDAGGHAAYPFGPFGRFLDAVIAAHDMVFEPVEPDRMGLDVILVVRFFFDPRMGDRELQGGIGIRKHRYPFVGMHSSTIVDVGANIYLPNAYVAKEEAVSAWEVTAPPPRRRNNVAAPE